MVGELAEADDVAAAVEGCRQAQMALRSLMFLQMDPDALFKMLRPAFEEGGSCARAMAMMRVLQKHLEAVA